MTEERFLHKGEEVRVDFQVLDLAVTEGGPFMAFALGAGFACARFAVQLHRHPIIVQRRASQHDVVHALL